MPPLGARRAKRGSPWQGLRRTVAPLPVGLGYAARLDAGPSAPTGPTRASRGPARGSRASLGGRGCAPHPADGALGRLLACRLATPGGSPRPFGGPLGRAHHRGLRLNALPRLLGYAVSPAPDPCRNGPIKGRVDRACRVELIDPRCTGKKQYRRTNVSIVGGTRAGEFGHAGLRQSEIDDEGTVPAYNMQLIDEAGFVSSSAVTQPLD